MTATAPIQIDNDLSGQIRSQRRLIPTVYADRRRPPLDPCAHPPPVTPFSARIRALFDCIMFGLAGRLGSMDFLDEEQHRAITMKSSSITLHVANTPCAPPWPSTTTSSTSIPRPPCLNPPLSPAPHLQLKSSPNLEVQAKLYFISRRPCKLHHCVYNLATATTITSASAGCSTTTTSVSAPAPSLTYLHLPTASAASSAEIRRCSPTSQFSCTTRRKPSSPRPMLSFATVNDTALLAKLFNIVPFTHMIQHSLSQLANVKAGRENYWSVKGLAIVVAQALQAHAA